MIHSKCLPSLRRAAPAVLCLAALGALSAAAGIRYWDNPAYRAFDVDCYVPGAVWNLDGIRNVGADLPHSDTALTWVNLGTSGADNDVFLRKNTGASSWATATAAELVAGTYGEWAEDGFLFKGNSQMRANSPKRIDTGTDYTIQFLVDANTGDQTKANAAVFNSNWQKFSFIVLKDSSRLVWKTPMSYSDSNNHGFISSTSFDYATAVAHGDDGTTALFSGTEAPSSGDGVRRYSSITAHGEAGYTFGSTGDNAYLFVGTLKSFRYYKKALSNEEVAWNRVVDERRFFDRAAPLPVTNAVVASAVEGLSGVEPAGCYAVEGSHVFTAPRVATKDGHKYICKGYTLETWNAEAGDWGDPILCGGVLAAEIAAADLKRITWQWMNADGLATYDVSDYVWDGLVLFYDGICNAGTNETHSVTTTTWKNLGSAGAKNDMFLQLLNAGGTAWTTAADFSAVDGRDPGAWTADGFALKGDSRFRCNSASDNKITVGTDYSLQMLLDAKAAEQKDSSVFLFSLSANLFSLILYKTDGEIRWRNDSDPYDTSTSTDNALSMAGTEFSYLTAIMDSDAMTTAIFDGTEIPSTGDGFRQHETLKGHSEGGYDLGSYGNANYDKLLTGTIKFFRQYDHSLSPEEIAQNRKVDDFRYFGKFAETDVIVQSSHPALHGDEPDGEYDVDGSHTFTAPANVAIQVNGKEIEYACAGHMVERGYWFTRANTTFFVCTNAQTVVENSYTYGESHGLVRLTWLWKPVRGLRTAADYGFDDYSQAGLVWHYDGLYNAGVGVHDSTATTWKNLGDRANSDLHWNGVTSTGHWADDGYVFAGGPRFKGNAGFLVRNFTMQTLIDGDAASQTAGSGDHAYSFNGSSSYFNFRVVKNSFDGSAANSFCWVAQGGTYMYFHAPDNQYGFATGIQDFDNKKAMMFPDTTIPTEYVKDGTYGAQRLYHEFTSMSEVKDDGYGLGNVNAGNAGFVGAVKFFRYYDRVLTEEEIVRNRNADAVRYFGELGVTNLVVEVAEGATLDCDPAPGAYFVEGSWTFTASRAPGGSAPSGYRLQDWDSVNGRWTNTRYSEDLSFTYDAEAATAAKQRITWRSIRPLLFIVR